MKKLFLLALAAAGSMSVYADDYVNNINDKFREGYSLSVEWANLDEVANGNIRYGVGANDLFYINDFQGKNWDGSIFGNNQIKVYGELGLEKVMTPPSAYLWASSNADDAGNIIVRGSSEMWPGTGAYGGCFYAGQTANLIWVIDAETGDWVPNLEYNMTSGTAARWDFFDHVAYNALGGGYWQILACNDGSTTGMLIDFVFDGEDGKFAGDYNSTVVLDDAFNGLANAKTTTQGAAQYFGTLDDMDMYDKAAVSANPYAGITGANPNGTALSNIIQRYDYVVEDEVGKWIASGDYFCTPQSSDISGFMLFEVAGKQFIVYPAGNYQTHAGDAMAIAEVKYTDKVTYQDSDLEALVARTYGAANEAGDPMYITQTYSVTYNVQPVEGDPNSVYIYSFASKSPMVKYKFTVPEGGAGVDNVTVANDENAPVEYFNLNGVRVANPEAGSVYVRRQGASVAKVVL